MANLILSGYLPGDDHQGISALYDEIVADDAKRKPPKEYVVVSRIRAHTIRKTVDGDADPLVTVRIVAAEILRDDEEVEGAALLRSQHDRRVGPTMVDFNGDLNPDAVPDDPRPVDEVPLPELEEQAHDAVDQAPAEPEIVEAEIVEAEPVEPVEEPTPIRKGRGRGRAT